MSLDYTSHASHAGTLGPNELVPSRYALQIGDIDVKNRAQAVPVYKVNRALPAAT